MKGDRIGKKKKGPRVMGLSGASDAQVQSVTSSDFFITLEIIVFLVLIFMSIKGRKVETVAQQKKVATKKAS